MQEESRYKDIKPGELVLEAFEGEYETVPEGEPLKFHVDKVTTTEGKNYNTGEPETKLVVGFKLDEEIPGKGQVYNQWFKPSIAKKASLTKVIKAVFGTVPLPFDPTSLVGMPLRATLENKEKEGVTRQYINSYLKPAVGQKKVEADVVVTDVADGPVDLDAIDF